MEDLGRDPFNQNPDRSDREKWSTSKGGPVFSKLFQLDRTDPLSFGPKFPEILVEWIAPLKKAYTSNHQSPEGADKDRCDIKVLLQRCALRKFHEIEVQNVRDQITRGRRSKHA